MTFQAAFIFCFFKTYSFIEFNNPHLLIFRANIPKKYQRVPDTQIIIIGIRLTILKTET